MSSLVPVIVWPCFRPQWALFLFLNIHCSNVRRCPAAPESWLHCVGFFFFLRRIGDTCPMSSSNRCGYVTSAGICSYIWGSRRLFFLKEAQCRCCRTPFCHEVSRRHHAAESDGVGPVQSDSAVLSQRDTPPPSSLFYLSLELATGHVLTVKPRFERVTVAKAVKKIKRPLLQTAKITCSVKQHFFHHFFYFIFFIILSKHISFTELVNLAQEKRDIVHSVPHCVLCQHPPININNYCLFISTLTVLF